MSATPCLGCKCRWGSGSVAGYGDLGQAISRRSASFAVSTARSSWMPMERSDAGAVPPVAPLASGSTIAAVVIRMIFPGGVARCNSPSRCVGSAVTTRRVRAGPLPKVSGRCSSHGHDVRWMRTACCSIWRSLPAARREPVWLVPLVYPSVRVPGAGDARRPSWQWSLPTDAQRRVRR